jgi:PAS domain S-box-containing protein
MKVGDTVANIAEAAYATNGKGEIVAWNKAAEQLLGYEPDHVLGKPCYEILAGKDPFGNRFCDKNCTLINMARRGEPIHRFELHVRNSNSAMIRAEVSVVCLPGRARSKLTFLHLLKPLESMQEAKDLSDPVSEAQDPSAELSQRELQVLRLLEDGTSTRKIAEILFVSAETVRNHIKHVLHKLQVHSRGAAIALARRKGLL